MDTIDKESPVVHELILSALTALSIYPLNPVAEDTIQAVNVHVAVGYAAPNGVMDGGPEVSTHLELSLGHPFIVRTSVDVRRSKVATRPWPHGKMINTTFSADVLYYRGTNRLTAYVGLGALYALNGFDVDDRALDSLYALDGITDVSYEGNLGFRITVGLRYHKIYCFEMAFSRSKNQFTFDRRLSSTSYALSYQEVAVSDARISVGYIFPLVK